MVFFEILFVVFLSLKAMGIVAIPWSVFAWCFIAYIALLVISMIQPSGKRKKRL